MKKIPTTLLILFAALFATAQAPRLSLYEEFTGEECGPCAQVNPGLQKLLSSPAAQAKIISIKWQVPIPYAPTDPSSIYLNNAAEIDWRSGPSNNGYGYTSKYTSSAQSFNGVAFAPMGLIDGRHQWEFGAQSDNPGTLNMGAIASAQSHTSAFSISMIREWDQSFSSVNLTVTINASANFTSTGALRFRLVMIERNVHFLIPPGSNGEVDFHDVARQSFPNIQSGTLLNSSWTNNQTQTFTFNCVVPPSVFNKAEVAFVGFIQDDGNKRVAQAALADAQGATDDAKAIAVIFPKTICTATTIPQMQLKNHGTNSITSFTLQPILNTGLLPPVMWTGLLAAGASTTLSLPAITLIGGNNQYSVVIAGVNNGPDSYTGNDMAGADVMLMSNPVLAPVTESFTSTSFPPSNWLLVNEDNAPETWSHDPATGAYGVNTGVTFYNFYGNYSQGDVDELYLPNISVAAGSTGTLSFDLAYSGYPGYVDSLQVLYSVDCGQTWNSIYYEGSATMTTAVETEDYFVPASTEWTTVTLPIPTINNAGRLLTKFRAINGNGNVLYVDNINLTISSGGGITSIGKVDSGWEVTIFPQPAAQYFDLMLTENIEGEIDVAIHDASGRMVMEEKHLKTTNTPMRIETDKLSKGIYLLEVRSGKELRKSKLVIQ